MRLSKIRIAGFKSFVDPVTLDLRSNLVGILGPNGCGKSNTIDAVRWVMGESSAKHLRGQSMDDVIFNGSSSRKPVGVASVELIFDNSDGQLGGEYAQYAEISVKRQVSRDGQSKYFLNSARCRRRDITDIFLGTGLGPRSYAIIEQGMISRLIEAKPEQLRNTLEEAAGISRYKDRRRETETRIRHTRENLERLTDLREEVDKQLAKLDRQAKAAQRFKALREDERRLEAMALLRQWQALQQETEVCLTALRERSVDYQARIADVRALEAKIEQLRQQYTEANDALNEVQGEYYQAGAEIARIEQAIQYQQETQRRQQESLQQAEQTIEETLLHAQEDREALAQHQELLEVLEPREDSLSEQVEQAEERLFDSEERANEWQEQWHSLQQRIAEPTRQAQVEKTRMEQLERQIQQQEQRLERARQETTSLSVDHYLSDVQNLELQQATATAQREEAEARLDEVSEQLVQHQQQLREQRAQLDTQRSKRQSLQGRLASLETLQQSSLKQDDRARQQWLKQHGFDGAQRLAEQLQVEAGWETALETVLDRDLDALIVTDLDQLRTADWPKSSLSFLDDSGSDAEQRIESHVSDALAEKITAPVVAREWVRGVRCIETLADALAQRASLATGESFVTRDGVLVGRYDVRVRRSADGQSGVLQRQQSIQQLTEDLQVLEQALDKQQIDADHLREQIQYEEEQRKTLQADVNRLHREEADAGSKLQTLRQRIDQLQQRQTQLQSDIAELDMQGEQHREEHEQAVERRNEALMLQEALSDERDQLAGSRDELQSAVTEARRALREWQDELQDVRLDAETSRTQLNNSRRQLERVNSRLELLEQQRDQLMAQMAEQDNPLEELQADLQQAVENRAEVELRLTESRQQVQAFDAGVREHDSTRMQAERSAEDVRAAMDQLKLDYQGLQVREQTVSEQFAATEFDAEALGADLLDADTSEVIAKQLIDIQQKIQRLGAINLAAIDEFAEQSERKVYLDQQNEDLEVALETLETAIRKIDRETRARFKETYDQVNSRLKAMFPRLFGGGECFLEMTDDDLLTTGIRIMARPPGKRISSIHLMSGGEKALTAVALVFAIFELNPAPFCMLDEVDAPLDEANVGRFCELVRHMADHVQFIFITHNKTTMELAQNLIGVTMREAGVSRLVAVDVEEAVKLANA